MSVKTILHVGSCLNVFGQLPDDRKVDLIFADPPFNIGYEYDVYNDTKSFNEYIGFSKKWIAECYKALRYGGAFWIAIGDNFAAELKCVASELGFTMRNWVIWHYTFGANCSKKFSRSKTHLLYFIKGKSNFTFNDDAVRVKSWRQIKYADQRAAADGKIPDDTWQLRIDPEPTSDVFAESRICGTFHERTRHPCQMPEAILHRIISACSNPGDLVFDPFAGSGTTLAVATKLERDSIGVELSTRYAEIIIRRMRSIGDVDVIVDKSANTCD